MILLRKEFRSGRRYFIWNVFLMVYVGGYISLLFSSAKEESASRPLLAMLDFIFLIFAPVTGFFISKRSIRYLKNNSYTQMLLHYKMLPIPLESVVESRIIQALSAMVLNGILFYGAIYFFTSGLGNAVSRADFVAFVLTWSGFGLLLTGPYIFYEFLSSGKGYMWSCIGHIVLSAAVAAVIGLSKGSLFFFVVRISGDYGLLSPLMWGCLIAGGLALVMFGFIVLRKLEVRDLV